MNARSIDELYTNLELSNRVALSKLISILERNDSSSKYLRDRLDAIDNKYFSLGITGPAGVGKSTIINGLLSCYIGEGKRVGVLAFDPVSPFSGGSLLGDRIRMQSHSTEQNVFIRSVSSMSAFESYASYIIKLFGLYRMDLTIVESVGAGQNDVQIFNLCSQIVVVLIPDMGDSIQVLKAGLLEIADIFVINKCDIASPGMLEMDLKMFFEKSKKIQGREIKIVRTSFKDELGFKELYRLIENFKSS